MLILKEEKDLIKSASDFQIRVSQYYSLNPSSPTYHKEYLTWLGRTLEHLHSHRELLAEKLGRKVASDSTPSKFIIKVTPYIERGGERSHWAYLLGLGYLCNFNDPKQVLFQWAATYLGVIS